MPVVTGRARLGAEIFPAASQMEAGAAKASREDSLS